LLALHRDYDFGDEMIMEQFGRVEGGRLFVNKASYPIVVLPPMRTLSASTVKLLTDFLDSGGRLAAVRRSHRGRRGRDTLLEPCGSVRT